MTSISRELGLERLAMTDVRDRVTASFAKTFDLTAVMMPRSALFESVA
jgi:hypothetical protein